MKSNRNLKLFMDFLMTVLLIFLMGFHLWGTQAHEWLGTGLCGLFILHQLLNRRWYKNLFRGKYTVQRTLQAIVNALLLLVALGLMYSGIVLSQYVFAYHSASSELFFARQLHMFCSYWGFVLISLHLGLHWTMLLGIVKRKIPVERPSKVQPVLFWVVSFLIAVYGIVVIDMRNFMEYLFLQTEFVFLDFSEPKLQFCLDYLSVMGFVVFFVHYGSKVLRKIGV